MTDSVNELIGKDEKDPNGVDNYTIDWDDFIPGTAESISAADWTSSVIISDQESPLPLVIEQGTGTAGLPPAPSVSGFKTTAWVSGGSANTHYLLSCKITTDIGRHGERSIEIVVKNL